MIHPQIGRLGGDCARRFRRAAGSRSRPVLIHHLEKVGRRPKQVVAIIGAPILRRCDLCRSTIRPQRQERQQPTTNERPGRQCPGRHDGRAALGATRGSTILILVPSSGSLSRLTRPPRPFVTMVWTICRPRPVDPRPRRVVKKGSNALRRTSRLMPQPVSENRISTFSSPDACTLTLTVPFRRLGNAWVTELR